ncbi:MAG: DUF2892 domain-containing protein [Candidatus Reddybacter sp.]
MKPNEGNLDRALQVIVGLGLVAIVFVEPQTLWGWVGLIPLATGVFRLAPFISCCVLTPVHQKT